MGRYLRSRFLVVEVILEIRQVGLFTLEEVVFAALRRFAVFFGRVFLLLLFLFERVDDAVRLVELAYETSEFGVVRDIFGDDVQRVFKRVRGRFNAFFGVNILRGVFGGRAGLGLLLFDKKRQRLESEFARDGAARAFFRLVRQVKVFERLHFVARDYLGEKFVGHFALLGDRADDLVLARHQFY